MKAESEYRERADISGRWEMLERKFQELLPDIKELYNQGRQLKITCTTGRDAYNLLSNPRIEYRSAGQANTMTFLKAKFSNPLHELVLKNTYVVDNEVKFRKND